MVVITKLHLEEIRRLNEQTSYSDAQAVYDQRRFLSGDPHECYWMFWCGLGTGTPDTGIRCYICDKPWEGLV